jgi:uncharacterized protein YcbX
VTLGGVDAIWRYPIKSMRGERLSEATLTQRGLSGDRAYALIDPETGKVASAKHPRRWGRLLACSATVQSGADGDDPLVVRVTLPDGRAILTSDGDAERLLSSMAGREVTLASVAPSGAETEREYPEVDGIPVSGQFFSAPIASGAAPGTFFDFAPLHLITTATLARLRSLAPNDFDPRRFRPNLVIATPDGVEDFVENDWVGRSILIGDDVRLHVSDPTPRCVVPTLPQAELPREPGILRAIATHNRPPIPTLSGVTWPSAGVYATIERGGILRQGDQVWLAESD